MVVANRKNIVILELVCGTYVVRVAAVGAKNMFSSKSFFEALDFMDSLEDTTCH